jgi:phosphate transport system permease protein
MSSRLSRRDRRRKGMNQLMHLVLFAAGLMAVLPLLSVFIYVLQKGLGGINFAFFTELPKPVGETGGGMANALLGSLTLIGLASLVGIPWGVAAGVYLADYGRGRFAQMTRFVTDVLASVPSIIIGLFIYGLIVVTMKRFSALAGAAALAVIMIPIVTRTTEEVIRLIPAHIREAGLALGIPRWKVTLFIVMRGALGGMATGVVLAVARAAGETAPLLLTAFSNRFWARGIDQPVASLPVQIYNYAISPYEDWHQQAWAAALVLVLLVFALNLATRWILSRGAVQRTS